MEAYSSGFNTASGMDCMQSAMVSSIIKSPSFNTASGMDCMQFHWIDGFSYDPEAFQYRKRYGLHAIFCWKCLRKKTFRFNTASGMDCMQLHGRSVHVWLVVGFNTASGMDCMQF